MKASRRGTVAALARCALGAALVQGLHAQAKPAIYYVVESASPVGSTSMCSAERNALAMSNCLPIPTASNA
jgi:hypothetical protein